MYEEISSWEEGSPYDIYFLKENPFPIVPIPEEEPTILGVHEDAYGRVLWQLSKVARTGRPVHIVVVGPYGSGKTHLLRYLTTTINNRFKGGLAAYVPHPGPDFISIYRRFVESLGYHRLQALARDVEESQLRKNIVYQDFVTALTRLNEPKKGLDAWRWLTANKLTFEERETLGVATSIERSEDALNAFSGLLKFLRGAGFRLISMFIDEFEEITSLVQLQKRKLFNDLRHLIDLNVSNFSLTVACSPKGWNMIYEENAALVRRFSSNLIFLQSLDEDAAMKLVSSYLERFRTNHEALENHLLEMDYNKDHSKIYPFTVDGIHEICSLSKGNVGEILKYSGIAIEMGIIEKHKIIDGDTVNLLITKYYGKTAYFDEYEKNENLS